MYLHSDMGDDQRVKGDNGRCERERVDGSRYACTVQDAE